MANELFHWVFITALVFIIGLYLVFISIYIYICVKSSLSLYIDLFRIDLYIHFIVCNVLFYSFIYTYYI